MTITFGNPKQSKIKPGELPVYNQKNAIREDELFDVGEHLNKNLDTAKGAVLSEMKMHDIDFASNPCKIRSGISRWSDCYNEGLSIAVYFEFCPPRPEDYDIEDKVNEMLKTSPLIRKLEKKFGSKIEAYATFPEDMGIEECIDKINEEN